MTAFWLALASVVLLIVVVRLAREVIRLNNYKSTHPYTEVEREPVPEPGPFQVRRVEWRLGEAGIRKLIVDYEGGLAVPELQTKHGLSKGSVRKLLSEAGVSMRRRPLPDSVVAQIIELYGTGLSIREVAAKVGVPKTTVQNLLAQSDVAMRPAVRAPRRR